MDSTTVVARLRRPVVRHPYADEPEFQAALNRVAMTADVRPVAVASDKPCVSETLELARLGEYQLLAKLGEGGMGAVYKARQTNLDRMVALKVLPASRSQDHEAIARFYREMRAVGRLRHPNIVEALDAREIDGSPMLAMEYLDGIDLSKLVHQVGQLPVADACELIRQAALGLQHAHEHGQVHRDIKPSNLMLTVDGTVKILDLGLALLDPARPQGLEMTAAGRALGTADYISPEQVTDSHSVDIRSDIYSLGCTLYKLLGGRAPFSGPQYKSDLAKLLERQCSDRNPGRQISRQDAKAHRGCEERETPP
jgi:serine/threonine protein kinase